MPAAPRLLENRYLAIKQCRHGLFAYNLNDAYIGRCMDVYGEWSEGELSLLFQVLKPGGVVLDVGANIGTHTVAFAKHVTSSGAVIAFEPQRLTFQLLCTNVTLNTLVNVRCVNAAVSDRKGELRVPMLDPGVTNNFGGLSSEGHTQGEIVEMVPIDGMKLPRCNLIKIDVEGAEAKVLAGARQTIKTHRPVLFIENNKAENSPAILKVLNELGYASWWHFDHYFSPQNYFGASERIFGEGYREANMLCFPAEAKVNAAGLLPVAGLDDDHVKALQRHS